jgi:hypothetical protein
MACGCTHKFDLSPIKPAREVKYVDVPPVTPSRDYAGDDWHVILPVGWSVYDKNKKISENVFLDVEAHLSQDGLADIAFVASRLEFDDDTMSPESFAIAAVAMLDRNGMEVKIAVPMMYKGRAASVAVARHVEKELTIVQLAVMNGSHAHMFRCISDGAQERTLDSCFSVLEAINLDDRDPLKT